MQSAVPNTCQSLAGSALDHQLAAVGPGGFLDTPLGLILLPGEYVTVPARLLARTAELAPYLAKSYDYAKTLKPKHASRQR